MSRIYLVRHGEVEGNSGGRRTFAGWADLPLTLRGEIQAQAVAARLGREPIGYIAASDLQRARLTAEAIAERHGLPVEVDRDLREVNYGRWEGLSDDEIARDFEGDWVRRVADPENCAPTEGESLAELARRLAPAWARVIAAVEASESQTGVVVAHNGPIRVLLCGLLGMPLNNFRRLHCNNCGLSWVERGGPNDVWTVMCVNDTTHLKTE